jgi:hypothetical protein
MVCFRVLAWVADEPIWPVKIREGFDASRFVGVSVVEL